MATNWTELALGEFIELKRGYDLPDRDRVAGPVPLVSSSGITGRQAIAKVKGPGVVTGRYGTLGEVFYLSEDFWPLNTTLYVRDFKGNDPRFVNYLLQTIDFGAYSDKAAVPGLNRNDLHLATIRVPSDLAEQRRIGEILGDLDDKIALNARLRSTCAELARAVLAGQGGPVRAGDVASVIKGIAYKGADLAPPGAGALMVNLGSFAEDGMLARRGLKGYRGDYADRHVVRTGDLLIANVDLTQRREILGRPALIPDDIDSAIFTNDVYAVRFAEDDVRMRLSLWRALMEPAFRSRAQGFATGTTVARLPDDAVLDFVFELADAQTIAAAQQLLRRAWLAERETANMGQIRAVLLPRLLSGELRVDGALAGLHGGAR